MGIIVENMSFSYETKDILQNINLKVNRGEHIGIIGESGCGKTTLLKLLSGLYDCQSGFISVAGEMEAGNIRKRVAMVLQTGFLFPTSILENITCGHEMDMEKVWNACEAAQLMEWIQTLPDGIHTYVGERGNKVSGGQAQRIAIARAIAKDAQVVLLDEVTSALDSKTEDSLLEALKRLTIGKTVINVSHRKKVLYDCNRVYRMESGELYLENQDKWESIL